MTEMRCTKCHEAKAAREFHRDRRKVNGLRSECKVCVNARMAAHYATNREAVIGQVAAYRNANRKAVAARKAAYHAARKDSLSAARTARKLGVPIGLVEELRKLNCAICDAPPGYYRRAHHVDHDHGMTGIASVRGTLCCGCNVSLGHYERTRGGKKKSPGSRPARTDCPVWTRRASSYLDRYSSSLARSKKAAQPA